MKCQKTSTLMKKEVVEIEYDSFEEYAEHYERMCNRGYDAIKTIATHTSEKMKVVYRRFVAA